MAKKLNIALDKAEMERRNNFFEKGSEAETFSEEHRFKDGHSMTLIYGREDGKPFAQSILKYEGYVVDVSEKETVFSKLYVNSHDEETYYVKLYTEWLLLNYFSKAELRFLKKGDAAFLVTNFGTEKNVLVKEICDKWIDFMDVEGEEIELPLEVYDAVWKLATANTGLLDKPLTQACFNEAIYRLHEKDYDAPDSAIMAASLTESLHENVIFAEADVISDEVRSIEREYLHTLLSTEAVDVLKRHVHDLWNMSTEEIEILRREISFFTESQKKIFCSVVGFTYEELKKKMEV